jgi:hypothetical protein
MKLSGAFLACALLLALLPACEQPPGHGEPALLSIAVTAPPEKTVYLINETFDPAGLEIAGTYDGGTKRIETDYALSPVDTSTKGTKTVTVTVKEKTASFAISVGELELLSIAVTALPEKTVYLINEAFDPAGLEIAGTYDDGAERIETDYELSPVDTSANGTKTVTVTVRGKTASFAISVGDFELLSIEITALPEKIHYAKGEAFEGTGLMVSGIYSNGEKKQETAYTLRGHNTTSEGTKTVTASLNGKTAAFTITVGPAVLKSISITTRPNKWIYTKGEDLDISGLVAQGLMSDSNTPVQVPVTVADISGYDKGKSGEQTLTITKDGLAAELPVYVLPPFSRGLYFDYGRRRVQTEGLTTDAGLNGQTGSYTVTLGRVLVLSPVKAGIPDGASYTWTVAGGSHSSPASTTEYFSFTPDAAGTYTVAVSTTAGGQTVWAETRVVCVAADAYQVRSKEGKQKKAVDCFEYTPAPGQFGGSYPVISGYTTGATEADTRAAGQAVVSGATSPDWAFSLGAFGGYVIFGFDHSVENVSGKDLTIRGNAFATWNEAGTVWVMQDENNNGEPDDTWYELKGDQHGLPTTKQRYAITYFPPIQGDEKLGLVWVNNAGETGVLPYNTYTRKNHYCWPVIRNGGDSVTFTGTLIGTKYTVSMPGYVDTVDPSGGQIETFDISDAVQLDGSPAALPYIDFVKVQTALYDYPFPNTGPSWDLGEVSTECGVPYDYSMP